MSDHKSETSEIKHPILVGVVLVLISVIIFALFFAPFGFGPYNVGDTAKTKDVNDKTEHVYGDGKGQPARQTKQIYTDTPEGQKRADAIKEKIYGSGTSAETTVVTTTDSTKKEPAAKVEEKKEAKATK